MMKTNFYFNKYLSWQWLLDAKEEYLKNFILTDTSSMQMENSIYIGVYGPTQVGKTTFILTLLGVNEEKIASLSNALRGKQIQGKSATVTATIFKKSMDERFHIQKFYDKDEEYISSVSNLDDLSNELKGVRDEITKKNIIELQRLTISIPKSYFYVENFEKRNLAIIDLPGDDTKDNSEEVYVEDVIRKYIKQCKCIIIMESSNSLVTLSQIPSKKLEKWYRDPFKYFVVITRAISDAGVNKLVKNKKITTHQELVEHYRYEISRNIFPDSPKEIENEVFPMELGESLIEMFNNEEESSIFHEIKSWNDKLLNELREKLIETESPEFQVKNLFNLRHLALEGQKEQRDEIKGKEKKLQEYKNKLNRKYKTIENYLYSEKPNEGMISVLGNLEGKLTVFNDFLKNEPLKHKSTTLNNHDDIEIENTTLNINSLFLSFPEELKYEVKSYDVINTEYNIHLQKINREMTEQLKDLEYKINNALDSITNFSFEKSYEALSKSTKFTELNVKASFFRKKVKENPYPEHLSKIKHDISQAIRMDVIKLVKKLDKTKHSYLYLIKENEKQLNDIKRLLNNNKLDIQNLNGTREIIKEEWQKEIDLSNNLDDIFIKWYQHEMKILTSKYNAVNHEDYKIILAVAMNLITDQIERLINYEK